MDITKLQSHLPTDIYDQLSSMLSFGIDGPKRLSHLLGQSRHETGNWSRFTENLNYSSDGLLKIFHKYFTPEQAIQYAYKPEMIANRVYANRGGNSDESSGDGYKFRGRGCLQTTLHDNYKALGDYLHIDLLINPDLVATTYSLSSAAFFFLNNHLWSICDQGTSDDICTAITRRVNGSALFGLPERIRYTQEFYSILTS